MDSGFVTIGFLLAFPVAELIMLGNWFGMGYTTSEINALYANLWQNGFMITGLAVAALAALFNGISQFWYLYSPRKIDFYHSLPVKRSRMFWHKTLQSLLYYLLPYLAMEFFSVCIGAMRGFFSLHLMKLAFLMMVFHLLFISAFVFFGCVCNLHYRPSAYGSSSAYCSGCLWTGAFCYSAVFTKKSFYYTSSVGVYGYIKGLREMASPVILAYTFVGKICRRKLWWHSGELCCLVTIAFGVLGYYAFVNRKSERTGMAFVFPWVGTIIRFMIVVPGGLWNRIYFSICCQVTVPERSGGFLIDSWNPSCWRYYGNYLLQGFPKIFLQ